MGRAGSAGRGSVAVSGGGGLAGLNDSLASNKPPFQMSYRSRSTPRTSLSGQGVAGRRRLGDEPLSSQGGGLNDSLVSSVGGAGDLGQSMGGLGGRGQNPRHIGASSARQQLESGSEGEEGLQPLTEEELAKRREARRARRAQVKG